MQVELLPEHRWLQQLVGEWTSESECSPGPGQPAEIYRGTETVRSLEGVWVVCEGSCPMPDGRTSQSVMSLGYDPDKKTFVGTFIASMMSTLWVYEGGELDVSKKRLALRASGPSFLDPTKTANYVDTIELRDDGTRTLASKVQGQDGAWTSFLTVTYRRKK